MNVNDPKSIITWRIWYLNLRPMGLWFLFWKVDLVHGNRIFLIPSSRIETCSFTSRDASTSLTSLAISRVRTKGIMISTFFRPISPRTIFTAWCSDQRTFGGSTWGLAMESDEHDGTIFWGWAHETTHKNLMGKHGKTWKNNKPFKAFQALRSSHFFSDFPSFQIPSMTIQQNLALSEIKVGTIFTTERGYEN